MVNALNRRSTPRAARISIATTLVAASVVFSGLHPAGAVIPPMPQGYPIRGLYSTCTPKDSVAQGYPAWHYGEIGRRYLSDGTLQFKNNTGDSISYTATVETGTNHTISANSAAKLPSGWNTTAKSDIGLKETNGWLEGETIGPVTLESGESFRVEYGVVEKDFISMFTTCKDGYIQNEPSADVIRGTGPAERYAHAYIIHADGSVDDQALEIPASTPGANSRPTQGGYTSISGPSLESVADPHNDKVVEPEHDLRRDPHWPKLGDACIDGYKKWYPLDVKAIEPTFRKPGYSQDFLNWSKGNYTFSPVTDFIVGAEFNGYVNWRGQEGRLPEGWLHSVGAVHRAYMPVGTPLKSVDLTPGERVRVEYGTRMLRVRYREVTCKAGSYSLVSDHPLATAPTGFWAEAHVTSPDGSTRTIDITPDDYDKLPVPTQSNL